MKLRDFFLNCLNRRSFQFLSYIGLLLLLLPITIWLFYSQFIYTGNNIYIDKEPLFFIFTLIILPTLGLITNLSIIIIYFKLLIRENLHPEYRLENKFLVQNQFYALFAFVFYIFAIVILANLLYIAGINLEIYKEIFTYPIYFYLFLIYTLIHIFIVKKV